MSNLPAFVAKRLVATVILAWAIVTVVFFMAHATPYDPIKIYLGQHQNQPHVVQQLKHEFGLDHPEWQLYLNDLGGIVHGDFGFCEERDCFGEPVWPILQAGIPVTLKLGMYALILALLVGLPIGLISALRQNSVVDYAGQSVTVVFYVIPSFVLVPAAQVLFGTILHVLPVQNWGGSGWNFFGVSTTHEWLQWFPNPGDSFKEMILPVTLYAAGLAGFFAKSFRSFMLEVLSQDYIRTARAKGLKNRVIIYLHAVKNTLVNLASIVGPTVAYLIVGAFVIELFFSIPGVAFLTAQAVINNDFSMIEATTLILALFVIGVNLLTDIFYAVVDPRVRL